MSLRKRRESAGAVCTVVSVEHSWQRLALWTGCSLTVIQRLFPPTSCGSLLADLTETPERLLGKLFTASVAFFGSLIGCGKHSWGAEKWGENLTLASWANTERQLSQPTSVSVSATTQPFAPTAYPGGWYPSSAQSCQFTEGFKSTAARCIVFTTKYSTTSPIIHEPVRMLFGVL